MAASRSMLESLLARVRQRAAEPRPVRGSASAVPGRKSQPGHEPPVATAPPAPLPSVRAQPMSAAEEIEEYDDDLIEIIDDDEVAAESSPPPPSTPPSAPLELRASAPSVEMRRRAVPPSAAPSPAAPRVVPAPAAPAAPAPAAAAAPAPAAPLRAEVVARRPVPAAAVVQTRESRPDPRTASFLELLDASLDLGD